MDQTRDWAFWFMFEVHVPVDIWKISVPADIELIEDPSKDMQEVYNFWIMYQPIPVSCLKLVGTQPVRKHSNYAPPSSHRIDGK